MHEMRPITAGTHIDADPDQVFDFVKDTRNDPMWCDNVEKVELIQGDVGMPGTTFRFHQHLDRPGGRRMQFDVDVTVESVEGRTITWLVSDPFQERTITIAVSPEGDGSKIEQTTRAAFRKPPGLARFVYPMLARKTFKEQFARLSGHFR